VFEQLLSRSPERLQGSAARFGGHLKEVIGSSGSVGSLGIREFSRKNDDFVLAASI
jgi:hypothetical protein